ncbi:MAG TPA: hypothetical protein ENN41_04305 [Sediminispirochaeta sp.]|nr:hypothetical protein [Sediminispirochaeta sp.]
MSILNIIKLRSYQESDREAALRIWHEVGWIEVDFPKPEAVISFIESGRAVAVELHGEAEALATTNGGSIKTESGELPFTGVTSVTVGRLARKIGAAGRATAQAIAEEAAAGSAVAGLSMFERGFYNRLGFGTGSYEHYFSFDPAILKVAPGDRLPRRLKAEEAEQIHQVRRERKRGFGALNFDAPAMSAFSIAESKNGFGLGFYERGKLSHFFWASVRGGAGPYQVNLLCYKNQRQLHELLGAIKKLGDQVRLVKMFEPPGVQLQDFLRKSFTHQSISKGGQYENRIIAEAFWQLRICNSHFEVLTSTLQNENASNR